MMNRTLWTEHLKVGHARSHGAKEVLTLPDQPSDWAEWRLWNLRMPRNRVGIESQARVQAGGRTGLIAVVTGLLFLLFMPLAPLVGVVPKEAAAGALIAVGVMMCGILVNRKDGLDLTHPEEAWPVVTTFMVMPLTYSITNGIGAGFLVYTLIRLIKRQRDSWLTYVTTGAFTIYFLRELLSAKLGI
jgi:adenine/guanine/hypoxanthine permease